MHFRFLPYRRLVAMLLCATVAASSTFAQGTAYCSGDGTGTACPCGNFGFGGGGCSNSSFPGAILSVQGTSSLANDTLLARCTLLPFDPSGSAVLFQGATPSTAGTPFGAGLLCISGSVRRLGTKSLATGLFEFGPSAGDAALSMVGQIAAPGTTMHYQLWYRDTLIGCSQPPFNLSNGLTVVWGA